MRKTSTFTPARLSAVIVLGAIVAVLALTSSAESASTPPTATTGHGFQLSSTSARVNGTVNPQGQATSYSFQYGATTSYGSSTTSVNVGTGTDAISVHRTLGDLTPNGTYHFRVVAKSSAGTTYGSDQTFSLAPASSHVAFMGRMGFVSPGDVIGVEAGCFGGDTTCTGHVTMTVTGRNTVIGQTSFSIPARSGGFQNLKLTPYGHELLRHNGVWKLLQVDVNVTTASGQTISQTMSLARWVWH
jgi:hypothetical protein